jgi:single-stranded-DNA-specific exonuclease
MITIPLRRDTEFGLSGFFGSNLLEIGVMYYRWVYDRQKPGAQYSILQKELNFSSLLLKLLFDRKLDTRAKVESFFNPDLSQLHDPFLFSDTAQAVKRVIDALREGEDILIYGDYDVDGITGVSLLYDAFFKLGGKVSFYIPNRVTEGYGLSDDSIKMALRKKVGLIITVDCGVTAVAEIESANRNDIDVIICDHHVPGERLPDAYAILNPKLRDSQYPFKDLAGVGVAFKLLQALFIELGYTSDALMPYLELVALGTAADIVPLLDENRVFVSLGLQRINKNPRDGIFALLESSSLLGREVTVAQIVYVLAPRLNAVGRMSNAKKAVHLLTSSNIQQARNIARVLEMENKARRDVDDITCQEAQEMIENDKLFHDAKIIILAKKDWHPGVIGIVASRIMEKYNRPTILISISAGLGKGSARSTLNFDIYNALLESSELLENFGGHKYAAGLTIKEDNIALFRRKMLKISNNKLSDEDFYPTLNVCTEINLRHLDAELLKWLKRFAPYGPHNHRPIFVSRNMSIVGNSEIVGDNHLRLKVRQDGIVIDAIGYKMGSIQPLLSKRDQKINAAYVIEENTWNGCTTIQMQLKDVELL